MSVLTHNQEVFSARLAQKTGLNINVVRGWVLAEGGNGAKNQNWLNLSGGKGPGGRFDHPDWNNNPITSADATARELTTSSYYKGIMATVGAHPAAQIEAIAKSPWDAGHYGGDGSHLVSTYHLVSGLPAPKINMTPSSSPDSTTKTPENKPQTPLGTPKLTTPTGLPSFLDGSSISLPTPGGLPALHMSGSSIPLPPMATIELPKAPKADKTSAPKDSLKLPTTTPSTVPSDHQTANFEGTTVAAWMVPALKYARANGWTGKVISGVRSTALQAQLYDKYKAGGNIAAKPGQSNHEAQNGGAVDVTDPAKLNSVLSGFKGEKPIWAKTVGLDDNPHFSVNGH